MAKIKLTAMQKKIALLGVVLLLAISVALAVWHRNQDSNKDSSGVDDQPTMNDLNYNAAKLAEEGNFDEALNYYDKQVEGATSVEDKVTVLIKKSRFALGKGKNTEAVQAAKQAYDLEKNERTTRALADAYVAEGNKEQALIYYRNLLDSSSSNKGDERVPSRGPSVQQIINELEK